MSSLLSLSQNSSLSVEQVELLTRNESQQLMVVADITTHAINVFGNIEKAISWLGEPIQTLNGDSPLSRLGVSGGKAQVRDVLYRIEYGEFT